MTRQESPAVWPYSIDHNMQHRQKITETSTEELIARGDALLASQTYKEAIEVYKQLLKRQQCEEWRKLLATAYLERAKELAAKAMYKEATVIWDNIATICGEIIQPELHIEWLIRAGQPVKAIQAYKQYQSVLKADGTADGLDALLALLLLVGNNEVAQALPADSHLGQQHTIAEAALRSYCQGADEASIREQLTGISFRSAYRDFRQILSALLKLESDPADALRLVERMPMESPYNRLADVIRTVARQDELLSLLQLDYRQQEVAAALLGMTQDQLKLLRQWASVRNKANPRILFDFVVKHLLLFDREQARKVCLALLADYQQGINSYTRVFGPLPPLETNRLLALQAERDHDEWSAMRHWQFCADLLAQQTDDPDNALAAALILRHMVELAQRVDPEALQEPEIRGYLERSLELDPADKASYLELANAHKQAGNAKDYHYWVEQGVQQFPTDSDVLLAAVDAAITRKAFKKAANFAAKLLELDPINNRARTILVNAHLAHAQKLIKSGKYPLAEKELDNAARLERQGAHSGRVEINRGLLAYHLKQQDRMRQELGSGASLAGGMLQASLRLWVEACLLNLEPEDFQPYAKSVEHKLPASRDDILALVRLLYEYRQQDVNFLDTALENLEAPLKKSISQLSAEDDLLAVCECLQQIPHFELLEYFASQALKQKPRPLLVYYQIYGRAEGNLDNVSDKDYQRLDDAWEEARQNQEHRTLHLIDEFFSQELASSPPPPGQLPPLPPEIIEQLATLRDELHLLPPAARDQALQGLVDEVVGKNANIPPELAKLLLNIMLMPGAGANPESTLPDVFPLPFDPPRKSRAKRKKSRKKR